MRWAMNDSMAAIFRQLGPAIDLDQLPSELASMARAGLQTSDGRVHLLKPQVSSPPPPGFDDYAAEMWSNEVLLRSQRVASDPTWRLEVVAWGATLAERLLRSHATVGWPIQATVSLQSEEGKGDPEADHATGVLHVYCIRSGPDDASSQVDRFGQPVMVLTVRPGEMDSSEALR